MTTVHRALEAASASLGGREGGRTDAELLLAHVLGASRSRLLAYPETVLDPTVAGAFAELVAQRARGVPVAYLVGCKDFWSLTLTVSPAVLVPRPETELLVELALAALHGRPSPRLLDLGAGSGAIGLALATERQDARVWLVDASAGAAAIAATNRASLGIDGDRVRVLVGDWYAPLPPGLRFDLVVSNPPYLAVDDPHLVGDELAHEPNLALVSGPTGLEALLAVASGARARLAAGGTLLLEHGTTQGARVRAELRELGFLEVATHRDLAGHERATGARAPG